MGTLLFYDSALEIFEDCGEIQADNPFEGEERFVPVKICKLEEREIIWRAWEDADDLKSSKIKFFEPSSFLEEDLKECRQGESSADAGA
jgi:hypothetical protein